MQLIDTHIHLYAHEYEEDRDELLRQANEKNIQYFMMPNIDSSSKDLMLQLAEQYQGQCFPMMGLHPCSVKENFVKELKTVETELKKGIYYGVGEIGLDLYWDLKFVKEQEEALRIQLQWASETNLPAIIHSRESTQQIIDLIQSLKLKNLRGIFHCFSGTLEQAKTIIDFGFHLGIGGVVTYKNSGVDKTLTEIDIKHLVLETDGPYLPPTPHRGKRNIPAYLYLIAEKLAAIKNISVEEVADATSDNAMEIFGI